MQMEKNETWNHGGKIIAHQPVLGSLISTS
jgi:hypothetical protein